MEVFFVLRRLPVSSLRTLMRMDRLGTSSEDEDGCAFGLLTDMVLLDEYFCPASVSVPDATSEDNNSAVSVLRRLILMVVLRRPFRSSVLDDIVLSGDADRPTAWAVDRRPLRFGNAFLSLRTGAKAEK